MSLSFYPVGIGGRSTLAEDTPGALRYSEYQGADTNEPQTQIRLFNDAGEAAVVGAIYLLDYNGNEEENPRAIDIAAGTINSHIVVAVSAVADQDWGWYAIGGYVDALVHGGTDVAISDYLKTAAGTDATALFNDTTSKTVDSFAIACAAQTAASAVLTKVFLLGVTADVD